MGQVLHGCAKTTHSRTGRNLRCDRAETLIVNAPCADPASGPHGFDHTIGHMVTCPARRHPLHKDLA
jgi:hypothetical protein